MKNFLTALDAYRAHKNIDTEDDTTFGNDGRALYGESEANPCNMQVVKMAIWSMAAKFVVNTKDYFSRHPSEAGAEPQTRSLAKKAINFFRSFDEINGRKDSVHYGTTDKELRIAVRNNRVPFSQTQQVIADTVNYLGRNGSLLSLNSSEIVTHLDFVRFGMNALTASAAWDAVGIALHRGQGGAGPGLTKDDLVAIAEKQSLNALLQDPQLAGFKADRGVMEALWNFSQSLVQIDKRVVEFNAGLPQGMGGVDKLLDFFDRMDGSLDGRFSAQNVCAALDKGAPQLLAMEQFKIASFM